ncbi:hypothetical protein F5Y19DRAFT_429563 [Xylariaceae sp. FL1651]|nr:hypothetical protein F5Y19DRAFT_429563 [Xylariaceae sp. FL1651]
MLSKHVSAGGSFNFEYLCRAAYRQGLGNLWEYFESKLPDLFVDDANESRVRIATAEQDQVQWVSTTDELCTIMESGVSTLLILDRYNSWAKIDTTIEGFSVICNLADITPFFLHFVVGMGVKFSSKDEDFMSCYSTFSSEENCQTPRPGTQCVSVRAICYNIRYFERHARDLEDPWSCRQSAIHHSFLAVSGRSTSVVIQPPEAFDLIVDSTSHPMSLHIRYLHAAIANWREYLDSFAQRFNILNQQIAIPKPYQKFKINFSHEQHLHYLRGKVHHARNILINMRNTISLIADHELSIAREQNLCLDIHEDFQRKLRNISREVENYIETAHKLLYMSDDLKSMYSNILTFHGQELQHDTSLKLAYLAQDDSAENKDMAVLADLTYKDSRSMRIATAIAMFYLPVNLVLSFFSTTLVWYGASENGASKIQVRSEVWIASVAAILLAIATMCWSQWWNWREQRKPSKNTIQGSTFS